jgi:xanthine/CO dehydrogenase XdhC/CoxF family maturation factor
MAELSARGECFATITIIGSKGSSPGGLGAKMVVREDGSSYFVIPRPGTLT